LIRITKFRVNIKISEENTFEIPTDPGYVGVDVTVKAMHAIIHLDNTAGLV